MFLVQLISPTHRKWDWVGHICWMHRDLWTKIQIRARVGLERGGGTIWIDSSRTGYIFAVARDKKGRSLLSIGQHVGYYRMH